MRRGELLILLVLLTLAGYTLVRELAPGRTSSSALPLLEILEVGEALDGRVVVSDLEGRPVAIGGRFGAKATVLYAWSTVCPCVPAAEGAMRALRDRFPPTAGVAWVAVDGEVSDSKEDVLAFVTRLGAPYDMVLDPTHEICARVGFDRAAMVAVLDADGYLRFRGTATDDLRSPKHQWLAEALEAVLDGRAPAVAEAEPAYGCEFSAPAERCEHVPLPEEEGGAGA